MMIRSIILFLTFSLLLGCTTLFTDHPKIDSSEARAFYIISRKEGFKRVRYCLKSEVNGEYKNSHLSFEEYNTFQNRIAQIHNIGKSFHTVNESEIDYQATTIYNTVFRRVGPHIEEPYDLMKWGPLLVNDEGNIRFNIRSFYDLVTGEDDFRAAFLTANEYKPVFIHNKWEFATHAKVSLKPNEAIKKRDITEIGRNFGVTFDITHLSSILGRRIYSIENEVEVDREGKVAYYFNVVLDL